MPITAAPNRFYYIEGDVSTQLAPWTLTRLGIPTKTAWFKLRDEVRFRSDIAGGDIIVPSGFLSDLASIPQFAWSLFMACDDPRIELGGWCHDWLYGHTGKIVAEDTEYLYPRILTRRQCDRILTFEAMPDLGATRFQQWAVYLALRLFGRAAWNKGAHDPRKG
jgi:hypothetical protein